MVTKEIKTETNGPSSKGIFTPSLARILAIALLAYYAAFAVIAALLGRDFALWIAAPISGIPTFIIAKWEQSQPKQDITWRDLLKFPSFNYWNITWIVLTIFIVQSVIGFFYAVYTEGNGVDCNECSLEEINKLLDALIEDWQSFIILLIGTLLSHFCGGYIAGKLPNEKCPSPYRHAAMGTFIFSILSIILVAFLDYLSNDFEMPTEEGLGQMLLMASPLFLLSVLGVKAAKKRPKSHKRKLHPVILSKEEPKPLDNAEPLPANTKSLPEKTAVTPTIPVVKGKSKIKPKNHKNRRKHRRR